MHKQFISPNIIIPTTSFSQKHVYFYFLDVETILKHSINKNHRPLHLNHINLKTFLSIQVGYFYVVLTVNISNKLMEIKMTRNHQEIFTIQVHFIYKPHIHRFLGIYWDCLDAKFLILPFNFLTSTPPSPPIVASSDLFMDLIQNSMWDWITGKIFITSFYLIPLKFFNYLVSSYIL